MGLVETEGLVLRTYSLSDADKIVVMLTESDGLVRGVAKGARRLKSRFGSALEPFSVVKVSYVRKEERELVNITGLELEKSYFAVASEPQFLEAFSYATDLLQSFSPPHDPNERLFRMSKLCLETAAGDQAKVPAVIAYFEIWLLKLGGFLPAWERCAECGRIPNHDEASGLQADFTLICANCSGRGKMRGVSPSQREAFTAAQKTGPGPFGEQYSGRSEDIAEISSVLRQMISRILNREVAGNGRFR